jgi:hypothetical protein
MKQFRLRVAIRRGAVEADHIRRSQLLINPCKERFEEVITPERIESWKDCAPFWLAAFTNVSACASPWRHIEAQGRIPILPFPVNKDGQFSTAQKRAESRGDVIE